MVGLDRESSTVRSSVSKACKNFQHAMPMPLFFWIIFKRAMPCHFFGILNLNMPCHATKFFPTCHAMLHAISCFYMPFWDFTCHFGYLHAIFGLLHAFTCQIGLFHAIIGLLHAILVFYMPNRSVEI